MTKLKVRCNLFGHSIGLDFDRDYGIHNRTGWSAIVNDSYVAELVPLHKALRALVKRVSEILPSW